MRTRQSMVVAALLLSSASAGALGLPEPGSASPETLSLPSGPNSVRGLADDPTVSTFSGQVSYAVPIALPAAANGFSPTLALSYSGALGNGPMGIGWHLAFPVLERTLRFGVPAFNDGDEMELVAERGGRVVALGNGQYRVMGEGNWWQITAVNGGFVAVDGEGRRFTLGQTAGGRQTDGGTRVTGWYPESVVDVAGQRIDFTYTHDNNEIYLSALSWGPSQAFKAQLVYTTRPDRVISFRRGFRVSPPSGSRGARLRVQRAQVDPSPRLRRPLPGLAPAQRHAARHRRRHRLASDRVDLRRRRLAAVLRSHRHWRLGPRPGRRQPARRRRRRHGRPGADVQQRAFVAAQPRRRVQRCAPDHRRHRGQPRDRPRHRPRRRRQARVGHHRRRLVAVLQAERREVAAARPERRVARHLGAAARRSPPTPPSTPTSTATRARM